MKNEYKSLHSKKKEQKDSDNVKESWRNGIQLSKKKKLKLKKRFLRIFIIQFVDQMTMEGSEYGSGHLPSPALVVFSQAANGLSEALRIQRPFHSQVNFFYQFYYDEININTKTEKYHKKKFTRIRNGVRNRMT